MGQLRAGLGAITERVQVRYGEWKTNRAKEADLENHPEYQKAQAWSKGFTPKQDINYSWIRDFAAESYKLLHDTFEGLDEKADSIIKHMTGGTGLFALAAIGLATQNKNAAWAALSALPAVLCAFRAVHLAISARIPTAITGLPPIQGAVEYAEFHKDEAETRFLGQWVQGCEGLALAAEKKAKKVKGAYWWYRAALFLLLIPFIVGASLKITQAPPPAGAVPVVIKGAE
jgi:hypothetical protein